jgi:hypothetical protein
MSHFYDKQINNILSWHSLSEKSEDNYIAFMAEWIAFNAICYNLYYEKAVKERANINNNSNQIKTIRERFNQTNELNAVETKITKIHDKWNVNIVLEQRTTLEQRTNLKLSIDIDYIEAIIFKAYVDEHGKWYTENTLLSNELFNSLKTSLKKGERNFVVNMAKHNKFKALLDRAKQHKYKEENDIKVMADKNIIFMCEKNNLITIKDVLYQIRCNIFHGAKTPGDAEDDTIVKSALPILRLLVDTLIAKYKIKNHA